MRKKLWLMVAGGIVLIAAVLIFTFKKDTLNMPSFKEGASASGLLNEAKELEARGDLVNARNAYQKLINEFTSSSEIMNWQKKVENYNIKLLFSSTITPESVLYEVKPGDTLVKIAKEFNTTVELISKSNNLSSDKIMPGRKIKVWKASFTIFVDKSQNILLLKTGEEIFKTYIVSTGKDNSTPTGTFKITTKLTNPTWFKAGAVIPAGSAENVLGTRWLGFNLPGYGIHGTVEPQNLGKQVTEGCVRLSNSDVEELYTIVPLGTEVTIVD